MLAHQGWASKEHVLGLLQVATAAYKLLMALLGDTRQHEAMLGCLTALPTGVLGQAASMHPVPVTLHPLAKCSSTAICLVSAAMPFRSCSARCQCCQESASITLVKLPFEPCSYCAVDIIGALHSEASETTCTMFTVFDGCVVLMSSSPNQMPVLIPLRVQTWLLCCLCMSLAVCNAAQACQPCSLAGKALPSPTESKANIQCICCSVKLV